MSNHPWHNNDPEKLPWDESHTILCKDVFGGRVIQDSDQIILSDLVTSVFTPDIYDVNFNLVKTGEAPPLPDGILIRIFSPGLILFHHMFHPLGLVLLHRLNLLVLN